MIGIVTVLYNSAPVQPAFFESLEAQTHRDFTLYVVDNASPDDALDDTRQLAEMVSFPVVCVAGFQNLGIAAGNNSGIAAARADGCAWIVLANNDTVWEPDTLENLIAETRRFDATLAAPKTLIFDTDRLWYAGGGWNRWCGGTKHFKKDHIKHSVTVSYAPSCCLLIRADVFDRIGTMDERYFLYYDDSDFVRRATRAGETLLYVPASRIFHREGASAGACSPLAQYWLSRNLLLFTRDHFSTIYWWYVLLVNLLILCTKRVFIFDRPQWLASWRGLRDGVRFCFEKFPDPTPQPAWKV